MSDVKKELVEVATNSKTPDKSDGNPISDDNTENSKSQLFQADSDSYAQVVGDKVKGRHWTFIVYKDSAPSDWIERLENTGLPFTVSPYHDKDVNPDGSAKKAHWHVLVSYGNTTTYNSIKGLREITKGPFPLKCESVSGMYAYFTHKHNPEKYQYNAGEIKRYNGWEKVLEASDVNTIMKELTRVVLVSDIREYTELVIHTMAMDGDYQQVAMSHTHYFDRLCTSYRNAPLRALKKYYNVCDTDEERKEIADRIIEIEEEIDSYESFSKQRKY